MVLNLLPLPPLDGGRIVASLLPHRAAWRYAKLEPYGLSSAHPAAHRVRSGLSSSGRSVGVSDDADRDLFGI